jgi:hypothetical protein
MLIGLPQAVFDRPPSTVRLSTSLSPWVSTRFDEGLPPSARGFPVPPPTTVVPGTKSHGFLFLHPG